MLSDSDTENVLFNTKRKSASLESNSRGGESPMEIDSPPPLWLKSPMSKREEYWERSIKAFTL